jgi:hypothetical protein
LIRCGLIFILKYNFLGLCCAIPFEQHSCVMAA